MSDQKKSSTETKITDEQVRQKAAELITAGKTLGTAEGLSDEMRSRLEMFFTQMASVEPMAQVATEATESEKRIEKIKKTLKWTVLKLGKSGRNRDEWSSVIASKESTNQMELPSEIEGIKDWNDLNRLAHIRHKDSDQLAFKTINIGGSWFALKEFKKDSIRLLFIFQSEEKIEKIELQKEEITKWAGGQILKRMSMGNAICDFTLDNLERFVTF